MIVKKQIGGKSRLPIGNEKVSFRYATQRLFIGSKKNKPL